jgi:hypothetical protein
MALAAIAGTLTAQDRVIPDAAERQALAEGEEAPAPAQPTRVLSPRDAARLRALKGMTLQWISWDTRGTVDVSVDEAGVWRLIGEQTGPNAASAAVEGVITEIGPNYFMLEGAVTILNTPDEGRTCEGYGSWRFEVTQNRKYYRLRQFEWCDDLTDYVDLYF